jgi:hypothetical protein
MRLITAAVAAGLLLAVSAADARPRRPAAPPADCWDITVNCVPMGSIFAPETPTDVLRGRRSARIGRQTVVVAHPAGCPRRAFCGCGAAVRVFGSPRRDLWLSSNWLRFPRSPPAPGTVAVRRGHVFVLEQHAGGDTWIVYDANSGGRRTRIHARSIRGYAIVNPRA